MKNIKAFLMMCAIVFVVLFGMTIMIENNMTGLVVYNDQYNTNEQIIINESFKITNINSTTILILFNDEENVYDLSSINYTLNNNNIATIYKELDNPGAGLYELIITINSGDKQEQITNNINVYENVITETSINNSNYTLTIFDDTDNTSKFVHENIFFYANLTNNTNHTAQNISCVISLSNLTQNMTFTGIYWIYNQSFNTSTNSNYTINCSIDHENISATDNIIILTTPYLSWQNNNTNFEKSSNYNDSYNYQFNLTLLSNYPTSALIEHNFTGILTNYSISNTSNVYVYNYNNLGVGNYQWKIYSNNTHIKNTTDTWYFEINKSSPDIVLLVNEKSQDLAINNNSNLNITGYSLWPSNNYVELLINDSLVSNGTNISYNLIFNESLNISLQYLETQNFSYSQISYLITENQAPYISPIIQNASIYKNYGPYEINLTPYTNEPNNQTTEWSVTHYNSSMLNVTLNQEQLSITPLSNIIGKSIIELTLSDEENLTDSQNITVFVPSIELFSNKTILNIKSNGSNSTYMTLNITGVKTSLNITSNNSICTIENSSLSDFIGIKNLTVNCNTSYGFNTTTDIRIDTGKNGFLDITLIPSEPEFNLTQIKNFNLVSGGSLIVNASFYVSTSVINVSTDIKCPDTWNCSISPNYYSSLVAGYYKINLSIESDKDMFGLYQINYTVTDDYGRKAIKTFIINNTYLPSIIFNKTSVLPTIDTCKKSNYSIYFKNLDYVNLTSINIKDKLPQNIYYVGWAVSHNQSSISFTNNSNILEWNKAKVYPDENFTINLEVYANCNATGLLTNNINSSYNWFVGETRNSIINSSSIVYINKPLIYLKIIPNETVKSLNEPVALTLLIENIGNATANNAIINYTMWTGYDNITFTDMSNSSNSQSGIGFNENHSIVWTINITPGDVWQTTINSIVSYCDERELLSNLTATNICGCNNFDTQTFGNITLRNIILNKTREKNNLSIGESVKFHITSQVCGEFDNLSIIDTYSSFVNTTSINYYSQLNITQILNENKIEWLIQNSTNDISLLNQYTYFEFNITQYLNNNSNDNQIISSNVTLKSYNNSGFFTDTFFTDHNSNTPVNIDSVAFIDYEPNLIPTLETSITVGNISDKFYYNISLTNTGNNKAYNVTVNSTYVSGTHVINTSVNTNYNDSDIFSWYFNAIDRYQEIITWFNINNTYKNGERVLGDDIFTFDTKYQYYSYDKNSVAVREYNNNAYTTMVMDSPYTYLSQDKNILTIGEKIQYKINLDFNGIYANNVTLRNELPLNTVLINYTNTSYADVVINGNTVYFKLHNITIKKYYNFTIDAYVNLSSVDGDTLTNNMQLTYHNSSNDLFLISDNINSVVREPKVEVTKELLSPNIDVVDGIVQYKITIINNGQYSANNITITDNITDGLYYSDSSKSNIINGRNIIWNFKDIPGLSSKVIYLNLTIDQTYDDFSNVVSFDTFDNNVFTESYSYNRTIALGYGATSKYYTNLTKSDTLVTIDSPIMDVYEIKNATIGQNITYELKFNFSNIAGNNITINTTLPSNFVYLFSTPTPSINNNKYTWDFGNVSLNIIYINYTVYINDTPANIDGKVLPTTFSAQYQDTSSTYHYLSNLTTSTVREPYIIMNNDRISQKSVSLGDIVEYRISIFNNGNSTAFNISSINEIPNGMIVNSTYPAYNSQNGNLLYWDLPNINAKSNYYVYINLTVNETYNNGIITSSNDTFVNYFNLTYHSLNENIFNTSVREYNIEDKSEQIELKSPIINKLLERLNATIGQNISYHINTILPNNVRNLTITDTLPNGLIYVNDSHNANVLGNKLTWFFNDTNSGIINISINVFVNDTNLYENDLIQNNFAYLDYINKTNDRFTLSDSSNKILITEPDLTLSKNLVSDPKSGIGFTIEYNISIDNVGLSPAYNLTIRDMIPNGTYLNSTYPAYDYISDGIVYFNLANLQDSTAIHINFTVNETYDDGSIVKSGDLFSNTANITYYSYNQTKGKDYDGTIRRYDNSADADILVIISPILYKEVKPIKTTVGIGENIDYVINVNYTAGARNVTVFDDLPNNTIVYNYSFVNNASEYLRLIEWDFGDVDYIHEDKIDLKLFVNDSVNDGYIINKNYANLSYIGENGTLYNLTTLSNSLTVREPLLIVTLNENQSYFNVNDIIKFNINISNIGNYLAYNTTVIISIPDGLYYYNSNITPVYIDSENVIYNYPTIGSTDSISLELGINNTYRNGLPISSNDNFKLNSSTTYFSFNQSLAAQYNGTVREYQNYNESNGLIINTPKINKVSNTSFLYENNTAKYTINLNLKGGLLNGNLIDNLPNGLTYINDSYSNVSTVIGNNISWDFGNITSQNIIIDVYSKVSSTPVHNNGVYIKENNITLEYKNSSYSSFSLFNQSNTIEMNLPPSKVGLLSPINNYNTTNTTPSFDWNDSIDYDLIDSITYYFEISNTTGFNDVLLSQDVVSSAYSLITPLYDGKYYWHIKSCDNSSKINNCSISDSNIFRIDTTAPNITIFEPDQNEILAWRIYLIANSTDLTTSTDSVWYEISNGTIMQSGTLNSTSNWESVWDTSSVISNMSDINIFNFTVYSNDSLGNTDSKYVSFIVDNKNPGLQLITPELSYHNLAFNMDTRLSNEHLNYTYYQINYSNGTLFSSNFSNLNSAEFNWSDSIMPFIEDNYSYFVFAKDKVGNNISKQTWFVFDTSSPMYLLHREPVPSYTTDNISLIATVIDNYRIDTVLIAHNATGIYTNYSTIQTGSNYSVMINWINTSNQKNIGWYVWMNDSAGNINISSIQNILVENRLPYFNPNTVNQVILEDSNLVYDINVSDYDYEDIINYTTNSSDFTIGLNDGIISWTPVNDDVGNHSILVTICDNSSATSVCNYSTFVITVINTNDRPSSVNISAPINNTITNNNTPYFDWTDSVDVDLGDRLEYYLIMDNNFDYSSPEYIVNINTSYYQFNNSISDSKYNTRVMTCDDSYSFNNCSYSENLTLTIDTIPGQTNMNPVDTYNSTTNNITLTCNVTDNVKLKKVIINSSFIYHERNISGFINSTSVNITNILDGIYNWTCQVIDEAGNTNTSMQEVRIDTTAPVISIVSPSNNSVLGYTTTIAYINISTDELSTCVYNFTNSTLSYNNMTLINSLNTSHNFSINVTSGKSYQIWYKCKDRFNNTNINSTLHKFSIASPPSGGGGGSSTSCLWQCSDWSVCQPSGLQTRTCDCPCTTCYGDGSLTNTCTYTPTCDDNFKNQDESDIDCGGSCDVCNIGQDCTLNSDCESNYCYDGICLIPSCNDLIKNQYETDVDCGGDCDKCNIGQDCILNNDCVTDLCQDGQCVSLECQNNIINGNESDIDCGGNCLECGNGLNCNSANDCISNNCINGICKNPSCFDYVINQDETDLDCGGDCVGCGIGKDCNINNDCISGICEQGVCRDSSCHDSNRNGDETDIDCGGSCYACKADMNCLVNSDCLSLTCNNGICFEASCLDGEKNQEETDIDCGGPCDSCIIGNMCISDSDCVSDYCANGICSIATCNDGILNGNEIEIDCGGDCNACSSCSDGIKNGDELEIDCGGKCAPCFSRCDDGTLITQCSNEKPKLCTSSKELINDCSVCGCPNIDDTCTSGICSGTGNCFDGIQNNGENGIDCGGPCNKCLATCNDGLQNQGENGVDCDGPCEKCQPKVEAPEEYGSDKTYIFEITINQTVEFFVNKELHSIRLDKIINNIADITIKSSPQYFSLEKNKLEYVDFEPDGNFDINVRLIDVLKNKIQIAVNVLGIFNPNKLTSIDTNLIELESMPCTNDPRSNEYNLEILKSNKNYEIPIGYDILIDPFKVKCNDDITNLTISTLRNYEDVKAIKCDGECIEIPLTQIKELKCGEEYKSLTSDVKYFRKVDNPIKTEIISNINGFDIISNDKLIAGDSIGIISEPKNALLKIVGKPLAIQGTKFNDSIKIKTKLIKQDNLESNKIYVLTSKDTWQALDTHINGDELTAELDKPSLYVGQSKEIIIAQIAKICANCQYTTLNKIYEPEYPSNDALLLVHGFGATPKTFGNIIRDIRLTKQPWQVWTYGYPTEKSVLENAINMANHLEEQYHDFEVLYIVGHSMGGLVIRDALYYAYTANLENPGTYKFINRVKKVVLIGTPNKGSPGAKKLVKLSEFLTNIDSSETLIDVNSPGIHDLISGKDTPMVPGINYFSIAGTETFEFGNNVVGLNLFSKNVTNDGIVSVNSATTLGDQVLNDRCKNFWEIKEIHTELLDNPIARTLIEKIIATEIIKDAKDKPILGNNQYYSLGIENCNDEYIIIGKKTDPKKAYDSTGCLCGNGFCGDGETDINCPSDCATYLTKEKVCTTAPFTSLVLIILTMLVLMPYLYKKYVRRLRISSILSSRYVKIFLIKAYIFMIIALGYFGYYRFNCIEYYDTYIGATAIITFILLSAFMIIYEWLIHEKNIVKIEHILFRIIGFKPFIFGLWITLNTLYFLFMIALFDLSEEVFASYMLQSLIIISGLLVVNLIAIIIYKEKKIKTRYDKKEKRLEHQEKHEEKEIKEEVGIIRRLLLHFKKRRKEILRIRKIEIKRKKELKRIRELEKKQKSKIRKSKLTKICHRFLHLFGLHETLKQKEKRLENERLRNLEKAKIERLQIAKDEQKRKEILHNKRLNALEKARKVRLVQIQEDKEKEILRKEKIVIAKENKAIAKEKAKRLALKKRKVTLFKKRVKTHFSRFSQMFKFKSDGDISKLQKETKKKFLSLFRYKKKSFNRKKYENDKKENKAKKSKLTRDYNIAKKELESINKKSKKTTAKRKIVKADKATLDMLNKIDPKEYYLNKSKQDKQKYKDKIDEEYEDLKDSEQTDWE